VPDERGCVPASQAGAELLCDAIGAPYERASAIAAASRPLGRWTEALGNERLVAATRDRLAHRCPLLEATGEGDRRKGARRRRQAPERGGAREEK
jgi:hypothetical protein